MPVASIALTSSSAAAHQFRVRAVAQMDEWPGFARGLFVIADSEHDEVGLLRHLYSLGDLAAVLFGIRRDDLIFNPRAADRDLAAFAVDDFGAVAHAGSDAVEHGDFLLRDAAVASEKSAMCVRSDHRDGLQLAGIERREVILVLQ